MTKTPRETIFCIGYQRTILRHGSSRTGTEEVKHPQPRILPKPAGSHREVCLLEPGSWKRAALCSGFNNNNNNKSDSKYDGLNIRAIPHAARLMCFSVCRGILLSLPISPGPCWDGLCLPGGPFPAGGYGWRYTSSSGCSCAGRVAPTTTVPAGPSTCSLQNLLLKLIIGLIFTLLWQAAGDGLQAANILLHLHRHISHRPAGACRMLWLPSPQHLEPQQAMTATSGHSSEPGDQLAGFACNSSPLHGLCRGLNWSSE